MLIPAPDLMGTTTSTPAVWEFTTSALAPVLHHDRLGKQISSVSDPMSSLGVCQDMMQTTITMVPPLLSSSLPLTSISHLESVVIAPQSECSPFRVGIWFFTHIASVHELFSTSATSSVADLIICTIEASRPSCSTVAFNITLIDSNGNSV
ncbi:hypothetical protein ACFX2J_003181 [Malus domestica]